MSDHYVYVLSCADDSLYTGYTTDVPRRVAEHDAGEGAKYTRGRTPVEVVHVERFDSQSAAMAREYAIKQLAADEKRRLVRDDDAGLDPDAFRPER
ncbi:GIY-YIG nuclease family protein [Halobaculum sp. MBLA0147]|uniref:GIY-YIG nuclease family protein n=1 Tax=Halobaculum sp. MBLA0147 TaxID=3079934 RepID=UPI0035254FED